MSTPGEARAIVAKAEGRVRATWRAAHPENRLAVRYAVPELATALDGLARADALLDLARREEERLLAESVARVNAAIGDV